MIGIVIFCHGTMATGTKNAAELIIGSQKQIEAINVQPAVDIKELREVLARAIAKVDGGQGAVVLTDLPGGTPANVTALFLGEKLETIAGFNLPLVIKVLMNRHGSESPAALAQAAVDHGVQHMVTGEMMMRGVRAESKDR